MDSCECTLHTAGHCGQLRQRLQCDHATVCEAFLEKCGILSEMFTGITERGACTLTQSE